MANKVGICNGALARLGVSPIASLTDVLEQARLCNQEYDKTRDSLLNEHSWSFAKKRVVLDKLSTSPPGTRYDFQYQLPSDRIWIKEYRPTNLDYEVEGDALLTSSDDVLIVYVFKNDDPESYDPLFVEAFELKLAARLAVPLREDQGLRDSLLVEADEILGRAKLRESKQDYNNTQEDDALDLEIRNISG